MIHSNINPRLPLVQLAEQIARVAHAGQYRRDLVTPYITHPERMVERLRRVGSGDLVVATAWLHDVLEDTEVKASDLREVIGIPEPVVVAVVTLTRLQNESYEKFLVRVKANAIARDVKIADNIDNLSDSPTLGQIMRYSESLQFLARP